MSHDGGSVALPGAWAAPCQQLDTLRLLALSMDRQSHWQKGGPSSSGQFSYGTFSNLTTLYKPLLPAMRLRS